MAWMVAIARNRAIDLVRSSRNLDRREPEAMEMAARPPTRWPRRELTEEFKRLLACIGRLEPERQRMCCSPITGWSREQLANKLDMPVNLIKSWLRRSLFEIEQCLAS